VHTIGYRIKASSLQIAATAVAETWWELDATALRYTGLQAPGKMLFELLLLAYATLTSAQTSSVSASTSSSGLASPASSITQTSPYPTHSVFFPGDLPTGATNLAASVITAVSPHDGIMKCPL